MSQTVLTDELIVVAEFPDFIHPGMVMVSAGQFERGGDMPCHALIASVTCPVMSVSQPFWTS